MVEGNRDIVVVDDDASMSQAIERLLTSSGWRARCFASAEDLLEWGNVGEAAVLVLDIQLPGMSGLELQRHLVSSGVRLPVVFITGHDQQLLREKAEQAGALAYLTKPFPGHLLTDVIRRHLRAA